MITVTPQGQVYLCKTPLESDYKNQLTFANKTTQLTYFNSTIQQSFGEYTYMKKDGYITVGINIDKIINCNYLFYTNNGFTDELNNTKTYFCFITKMEYASENSTKVYFITDCFQTYQFDLNYKTCFVEREHVNDDTVGLNTVPENVELGEYIVDERINGGTFGASNHIIVGTTIDLDSNGFPKINGTQVSGVYSGLKYYDFYSVNALNNILKDVATAGKSDGIVTMFMGDTGYYDTTPCQNITANEIVDTQSAYTHTWSILNQVSPIPKPTTLDTYEPVNKKLLTFPYCYLMASNNNGSNAIYKYELFSSQKCDFRYLGCLSAGMSIRFQPLNYNNQAINNEEGLNIGKIPVCSWNTDVFTNWLTQNGVNIGLSVGSSLLSIVGGIAMAGTGAGAIMGGSTAVNGLMGIANSVGQIYQHSLTPPQAEGNINNGDVTFAGGWNRISCYKMTIKREYAKIIDGYFNAYGYKVNTIKIPNIYGRQNWNFVKTIDCNFDGNIPQPDLEIIKTMFNNGVTLWHSATSMYNYSLSNDIVS